MSVGFFRNKIDLDTAQTEKMQHLLFEYDKETTTRGTEVELREMEFTEQLNRNDLDYAELEARLKEITTLQAGLGSFKIRKLIEARQFLNDDQYKKYKKQLLKIFFQ